MAELERVGAMIKPIMKNVTQRTVSRRVLNIPIDEELGMRLKKFPGLNISATLRAALDGILTQLEQEQNNDQT